MSLNSENVRVAVTGAVYVAPTTATRPTTATSALGADHKDLGYISDGGVTETRDRSTNQIRAWQNGALVREPVTESSIRYQFVLIETKKETIELYYGVKVAADGSIKIDPSKTGGRQSFVLDIIDDDDIIRIDVPSGEVTEVGDQVYVNGDPIGYEVTVTGYAITDGDESYSAVKWYSSLDTTGA
ncbi:hypothetical protein DEI99_005290 [Curtobacterium sp. MCLR17_036]|uniref:phage tail tube protein n=1 Tax=Curtobacterium sp. MCLR17_036 TaxID=2175620 RepID=UPI0011B43F07|nr:hypothetical protein [Curtobacterium sp. MCLR17_036]WIE65954.1 hypothetical protein DEI99_005290 [Curtobacterium sp. MCLR17_036]